jgi:hypothetical protein
MVSEARLDRAEKASRDRPRNRDPAKALEAARKDWSELMDWAHTILGDGDGLREKWAVRAAKDESPFFEGCDECRDRVQRDAGKQGGLLSAWAWHLFDHGDPAASSPPPVTPSLADHALTDRLREAASQSPISSVPAPEPAAVATDLANPPPVPPSPEDMTPADPERAPDWAWGAKGDESEDEWRRRFKPPKAP